MTSVDISAMHTYFHMLNNKIYTLAPSFVEMYPKMTKLCYFNQDNPNFLAF